MSNFKKLMMGAAAGADSLNVEDVFSTFVYDGNNGTAQTITNNIDLSGEGGLVWIKQRNQNNYHYLFDTEATSNTHALLLPLRSGKSASTTALTSFNSDGFSLGSNAGVNGSYDYVGWTFRKAPKFFDIVTYTGNGTSGRSISHNLGSAPGMIIIKNLDTNSDWHVWHRSFAGTNYGSALNQNYNAFTNGGILTATPTSSTVTIKNPGYDGVGTNGNNYNYVMYLFAHNNGDGEFGPDGDLDIIKCGSYTGNGSSSSNYVDVGFEPEFLLVKDATSSGDWIMFDSMRGLTTYTDPVLYPNQTNAEESRNYYHLHSGGFKLESTSGAVNSNGNNYVYVAIRKGPTALPESGDQVFKAVYQDNAAPDAPTGFITDFFVRNYTSANSNYPFIGSRQQGTRYMVGSSQASENNLNSIKWFFMNGFGNGIGGGVTSINYHCWQERRGFMDTALYRGNSQNNRDVPHNLGVVPEMIWIKCRSDGQSWIVDHKDLGSNQHLYLNATTQATTPGTALFGTHTASTFRLVNGGAPETNYNAQNFIAYLFASVPGVSKIGSYTGTGSSQTINCGFSSTARYILIKAKSRTGNWIVFDHNNGIVAGADPYDYYNDGQFGSGSSDFVDAHSSGFIVNGNNLNVNESGQTYIFYAIA